MMSKCKESPNLWPRVIKFEHKHIKAHERALVAELKENQYVVAAYTTGDHRDYTSASKPCTWCSNWPCMHVVAVFLGSTTMCAADTCMRGVHVCCPAPATHLSLSLSLPLVLSPSPSVLLSSLSHEL